MASLESLREKLSQISGRHPLTPGECDGLRLEFPGLPEEYLSFLETLGWGNYGEIMVYSGPVFPEDFDMPKTIPVDVLLVADNFQGTVIGFHGQHEFAPVEIYRGRLSFCEEDFYTLVDSFFPDEDYPVSGQDEQDIT